MVALVVMMLKRWTLAWFKTGRMVQSEDSVVGSVIITTIIAMQSNFSLNLY